MNTQPKALINTLTLTLALACGIAAAQTPPGSPPGGGGGGRPPRPPIDTVLDADSNEIIDAGEIANAVTALKKLDVNGDGQLTRNEVLPPRPGGQGKNHGSSSGALAGGQGQADQAPGGARPPQKDGSAAGGPPAGGRRLPPVVTALDVNGDGVIDADELANAVEALKKLDIDGDGQLSPDEYRPPRPADGNGSAGGSGQKER